MRLFAKSTLVVSFFLITVAQVFAQEPITWSAEPVVLESDNSNWTRMAKLPDGSWLAAYAEYTTAPTPIRFKRSFDRMRTWQQVSELAEAGRDLNNATLCVLPDGAVLLAVSSLIVGHSYRIETYKSVDNGASFQYQSLVDDDHQVGGLYEPYLYVLPSGDILCFYSSETHRFDNPSYSQIISEKVSRDGGYTWGPEIYAIAQPGAARPGIPNLVQLAGGALALFYEVCGSENCIGHVSYSTDGVNWPGIGPVLPSTFQDPEAVALDSGLIIATSNLKTIIISQDNSNSWFDTHEHPFVYGIWPVLYQTAPDEIAMVVGDAGDHGEHGQYIRFGTVNAAAFEPLVRISTCRNPTFVRSQNCF
jgi:hypothetical protein